MTEGQSKELYEKRRDLWSVTRVLVHCKGDTLDYAKALWASLTDADKAIIQTLGRDEDPEY